jgi:hypothetical protein
MSATTIAYSTTQSDGRYLRATYGNWRMKEDGTEQLYCPDNGLWYTFWPKLVNGVVTRVLAETGES